MDKESKAVVVGWEGFMAAVPELDRGVGNGFQGFSALVGHGAKQSSGFKGRQGQDHSIGFCRIAMPVDSPTTVG